MSEEFHKPTLFSDSKFDSWQGGEDPAEMSTMAHETARALLTRVRADPDPEVLERLLRFTDEHGIDAVAELWSRASAKSLPGALWRIYLLHTLIRQDSAGVSFLFQRGSDASPTIDPVVAGAESPTGPEQILRLADQILRGVFDGDLAVTLERAAAFCRVTAAGATSVADDVDPLQPERAGELTRRALRLSQLAGELTSSARLWRLGALD